MKAATALPSKRKPFNQDEGYVASRRTSWGWVVLYDRRNGGDWVDWVKADTRWVLMAWNEDHENLGYLDCDTLKQAREAMTETAAGRLYDWFGEF